MGFLIIGGLIFLTILGINILYQIIEYGYVDDDIGFNVIYAFFISGFVTFFTVMIIIGYSPTETVLDKTVHIESLNTENGISGKYSGNFLWGEGSVNSHLYYYYATKDSQGFYHTHKIKAESTPIKETTGKPKVITYKKVFTSSFTKWLVGKDAGGNQNYLLVPKNSIKIKWNAAITGN